MRRLAAVFAIAGAAACTGSGGDPAPAKDAGAPASSGAAAGPGIEVKFTDVTAAAGIQFKHESGAFGKKYLPETLGAGGGFADLDGDGWPDLVLVNGTAWPEKKKGAARSSLSVYRNNQDGTFKDVSKAWGLDVELYGMGLAAADYDNDGDTDLYVTALGPNKLFRNAGGKFEDVTAKAGVGDPGFSTGAAFFDPDKDGDLDLFVANYVEWTPEKDLFCTLDGKTKSYCTPESYKGQSPTYYRNKGDGTFENATQAAGLQNDANKALGVALLDYDADGWLDFFVANDTQPNRLYRNKGDGTFSDEATSAGVAFSEAGVARAGMGVDAADYDGSGRPSLVIGNFSNEMLALYHNEGSGLFIDEAAATTLGRASLLNLTFGCFFFDYDLDGRPDIFTANGHVSDDIQAVQPNVAYAQSPQIHRNTGKGFEQVVERLGDDLQRPVVARGAAYADYDGDGDLDLLLTVNNGPAQLFRNDGGNQHKTLRVKVTGEKSNRDGIGAKVVATLADGKKLWQIVKTGSSYCSQHEMAVTFGLGGLDKVASVEVHWPSGQVDTVADVPADHVLTVREGRGKIAAEAIKKNGST